MAAIVIPELGGGKPDVDRFGTGSLTPFVYTVTNLAVDEDPTSLPQIPQRGSEITMGNWKFQCDRVYVSRVITDTAMQVTALFSNDGRFSFPAPEEDPQELGYREWDKSYSTEFIKIPLWELTFQEHSVAGGGVATTNRWQLKERDVAIEFSVLNIRVKFSAGDNAGMIAAMNVMDREIGKIHIFPAFPNRWWQFLPPSMASTPESQTEVFVSYSWLSDPGSGRVGNPIPGRYVTVPDRPAFHEYLAVPSGSPGVAPTIVAQLKFPVGSPFYNPNGWQGLPGGPI